MSLDILFHAEWEPTDEQKKTIVLPQVFTDHYGTFENNLPFEELSVIAFSVGNLSRTDAIYDWMLERIPEAEDGLRFEIEVPQIELLLQCINVVLADVSYGKTLIPNDNGEENPYGISYIYELEETKELLEKILTLNPRHFLRFYCYVSY